MVSKTDRLNAIGNFRGCTDRCLKHILTNAEKLFQPKKIHDSGDWLFSHAEKNQTYDIYQKPGVKNLVTKARSKIYIFVVDTAISPEFLGKLKSYCQAFYPGMDIATMKPDSETFLDDIEVPKRENPFSGRIQYNTSVILKKV